MMASGKQKMEHILHLERIDLMDELMALMKKRARKIDGSTANPAIFRPSTRATRATQSEQLSAGFISLGLYNKDIQVNESTTIDRWKVELKLEIAVVFKETVKKSWTEICQLVVESPEDMKNIYDDCPIDDPQAVRNILTLDAVFVTCVLHDLLSGYESGKAARKAAPILRSMQPCFAEIAEVVNYIGIRKMRLEDLLDIMVIFQNQIPLQLITRVLEIMYQSRPMGGSYQAQNSSSLHFSADTNSVTLEFEELALNSMGSEPSTAVMVLRGIVEMVCYLVQYNLPGPSNNLENVPDLNFENYRHLLECVYWGTMRHYILWEKDADQKDIMHTIAIATATQLQKAGISIVRGSRSINDVRFQRGIFRATLILPQLRITSWTEMILRNLLEFEREVTSEFKRNEGHLMCYLSFMDELIDTEEDVLLLKERKLSVIEVSHLSSDIDVANIFNSLRYPSLHVPISKQWATLRKDIRSFYNNEKRQLWVEFVQTKFGRPWITASVVAAFALLVLTFLQTFYTVKAYYESGSPATS